MTISITNAEAMQARVALVAMGEQALPIKAAYRVAVLKRKLGPVLEAIEDVRKSLIEQHGKRDADNKLMTVTETVDGKPVESTELMDGVAFTAAYNQLLAQSQSLDVLPLTLDLFADAPAALGIAPDTLFQLGPLCVETLAPVPTS